MGAATGRKTAIVTGGRSGIGAAVADALAAEGWAVVTLDLVSSSLEGERAGPAGGAEGITHVAGDVTDPDANAAAVDAALHGQGRLDAFVANAGVHDAGTQITQVTGPELAMLSARLLAINVTGVLLGAQAAAPHLKETKGDIVVTLSDAAFKVSGTGAGPCYIASKHAALGVMRALAAQLAPDVRVNAVAPGGISSTDLRAIDPRDLGMRNVFTDREAVRRQVRAINPLGIELSVEEVAQHYLYLLSARSVGLTGQVIRPDGGLAVT